MSKVEVDQVTQQSGTTLTVGGGACKTAVVDATTVTLGRCGGTVSLASGATQSGFGRTGTVDWITTPKVTGDSPITGVTGKGYFLNTTAGTITLNLPAGAAGSIVSMADYAATWQTNNVTVTPNGTDKIGGINASVTLSTEGQSVTFVYVDSTQGWLNTMDSTSNVRGDTFMVATGGSVPAGTTCGNYKIHTFTGPGTLCVSSISCTAANNEVSYIVVAGGGGGGSSWRSGGGGAGGFREFKNSCDPYAASPLDGSTPITVTATGYPITVGGGGAGGGPAQAASGVVGENSVFSTITSAGGGYGGRYNYPGASPGTIGGAGGSGGGGGGSEGCAGPSVAGLGNIPSVSPAQGFPGGPGPLGTFSSGGGGGGATVEGTAGDGTEGPAGSAGGAGAGTLISPASGEAGPGPSQYYSGGGGGGQYVNPGAGINPAGGIGGGGLGGTEPSPSTYTGQTSGTVNTGGGGGGKAGTCSTGLAGSGGSGIVIIRYRFQ